MKANKWVAVLATCSVMAVAAPVSAQFGGLKSLKKAMDTVAKELEKPKPAPQPQPTERPTPPQSRPATSQGGYASSAPQPRQRTEQVQTPVQYQPSAVQQTRVAPKREVVATEIWRCLQEPDATPIKLEFNYVRDEAGQRLGSFTQTYTYEYEGKETAPPTISKGIFRSAGASYRLKYDDPELGQIELVASQEDSENGTILSTSRYTEDYPSMRDVETITQKFTDAQIKMFEATADDNPDGGIPLECKLIKPIFSKYSFDDFYVDRPTAFFEGFREDPKQPQFAGRDINFRNIRTMLSEAVTNHWYTPKFGKYFIVVSGGKHMAQYAYLIDMRSGKVHELFMETIEGGGVLDYKITENSNMVLSITADPEQNYCNLNYSKWNGSTLELIQTERLGAFQTCLNEYGTFPQPNYLQAIEDQYLQRNVPGETQTNAKDAVPPQASAPSGTAFATPTNTSASILGKWIPSDSDELYENQRTITRNGIEGYEWECEFTPPVSNFQRYIGTEKCNGSRNIAIELIDANTIQYSTSGKDGTVKEYWKRSNIIE